MYYQVANPTTGTWGPLKQLKQTSSTGTLYSPTHPIDPVYILPGKQNSFIQSTSPPITLADGRVAVPYYYWKLATPTDPTSGLENDSNQYSYTRAGVLFGTFNPARDDIIWSDSGVTGGLVTTKSTRGEQEPSIVELNNNGSLLMTMRGSNAGDPAIQSRAWYTTYNGMGWANVDAEMKYSTLGQFYAPSAMNMVVRNKMNNNVYWFGNINATNPISTSPDNGGYQRFPLVIHQVQLSQTPVYTLIKQTPTIQNPTPDIIATKMTGETNKIQYSNFDVFESPLTGQFTVRLNVYDSSVIPKINKPMFYVSPLPAITTTTFTPVDDGLTWGLTYNGDVQPTATGAITGSVTGSFANVAAPQTQYTIASGALNMSTGASEAPRFQFPSTTVNLDRNIGYTVEFKAKLNSVAGTQQMIGGASVQIDSGTDSSDSTTGGHYYNISLVDPAGGIDASGNLKNPAGQAVAFAGAKENTPIAIKDGWNTYRLTVFKDIAKLYVNGVLCVTDVSGGNTSVISKMIIGDFSNTNSANWDLDYFRVYNQGAVAPHAPIITP